MENNIKKKMGFNYDLAALPAYNSYGSEMLIKSFLGLTLPRYSSVKPNLKGTTEKVGFVTDDVFLQDLSCGFTPSGTTTQSLVTIDLCNKKMNMQLCPYDLYDTYLSQYLSNSNFQESIPFEEAILTDIANRVSNEIEIQLWRNTTATGATQYNNQCFNGMTSLITTGNGANRIAYTAATPTNGLDVFTTYYQNINENLLHRNDLVIYCSYSDYRALNKVYAGAASYVMIGMNQEMFTTRNLYDPFEDIIKLNLHATYGVGVFDVSSWLVAN